MKFKEILCQSYVNFMSKCLYKKNARSVERDIPYTKGDVSPDNLKLLKFKLFEILSVELPEVKKKAQLHNCMYYVW